MKKLMTIVAVMFALMFAVNSFASDNADDPNSVNVTDIPYSVWLKAANDINTDLYDANVNLTDIPYAEYEKAAVAYHTDLYDANVNVADISPAKYLFVAYNMLDTDLYDANVNVADFPQYQYDLAADNYMSGRPDHAE